MNPRIRPTSTSDTQINLGSSIQYAKGVGPKRAALFARLDIHTVGDLIKHLPTRYEFEHGLLSIGSIAVDHVVTVRGEVASVRPVARRGKSRFEATIEDETGHIHLVWFHGYRLRTLIRPGMELEVTGKAARRYGFLQMINPKWKRIDPTRESIGSDHGGRFRPVYPTTDGLSSDQINRIVDGILDYLVRQIEDHLPEKYRQSRDLVSLDEAYRMIHRPSSESEVADARRRLVFDELLLLQLGVFMKRHDLRHSSKAFPLPVNKTIDRRIRARFPFKLTTDQDKVVSEIRTDLADTVPMNRLLQGDVGSGKTVTALYAMLAGVAAKCQGALLAPTEILAEQHYGTINEMLKGSDVRIEILTGTLPARERKRVIAAIENGETDLVIGTHALLGETVNFNRLAVLVIDEQHRFGVEQRAVLKDRPMSNGENCVPHTLVMTATPIPRTLSLTLFGDLDISTIKNLPPGRTPITTKLVGGSERETVYAYLAERIQSRQEQAFVVLPAVDGGENKDGSNSLMDVRSHRQWLEKGPFARLRLEEMHGRLKRQERERIMERFRIGEIDALIATTVIEVGVDVPNATLMVVEQAERFGLSQLHQLRGRVGRGEKRSLCTMIANPATEQAVARLDAIVSTTDGFIIAEQDFEIRGMGEIFGTRQSGMTPFRVVEFPRDFNLLSMARRDAKKWIKRDPSLQNTTHSLLRKRLMKAHGQWLALADVG